MHVRVRLFAILRDRAGGRDQLELELPDGALVADALAQMRALTDGVPVVMAVNREYAEPQAPLHPDDELALIPPVSGGDPRSAEKVHVRLTAEPLSAQSLRELVVDARAGAIVTFEGVTREVSELQYEAYAEMAERQIAEIVTAIVEQHGLCCAAAEHRVGTVPRSEPSVVVAVSAPHRAEAFAGAREIIDRIKAQVPIFKQEEGQWVTGSPPAVED
jgi:molybdopterin synthase catalytic subunit/molybdopterin converting factor small subunit